MSSPAEDPVPPAPFAHDRLFRSAFSLPPVARELLEAVLPDELLAVLDWKSLRPARLSGVGGDLGERREDVLHEASLAGHRALFFFLLEHQSKPDRLMPLRVLEETLLVWKAHRAAASRGEAFPVVVPVVIYTGLRKWVYPLRLRELIGLPPGLERWAETFLPDAGLILVSVAQRRASELASGGVARSVLTALHLERRQPLDAEHVREVLGEFFCDPLWRRAGVLSETLWTYLLQKSDLRREDIEDILEEARVPGEKKGEIMNTALRLIEEGRQEGRREGWQEGRQEGLVRGRQEAILTVLKTRFKRVPPGLKEAVRAVENDKQLARLVSAAATCRDIEEFAAKLP